MRSSGLQSQTGAAGVPNNAVGQNVHLAGGSIPGMAGSMSLSANSNSAHKSKANISVSSAGQPQMLNSQMRDQIYQGSHLMPSQNAFAGHSLVQNNPQNINNIHQQNLAAQVQQNQINNLPQNMSMYPSGASGLISPATTQGVVNPSSQGQNQAFTMRPSSGSGGGALSNAGQMMMSSMHHLNVGNDRMNTQGSNQKQFVTQDSNVQPPGGASSHLGTTTAGNQSLLRNSQTNFVQQQVSAQGAGIMAANGQNAINMNQMNGAMSLTPQAQNGLLGAGQASLQSNTALGAMRPDIPQANQFYLAQGQNNLMNSPSTVQPKKDGQIRPMPSPGGVEARHQSIQSMNLIQGPQDFAQNRNQQQLNGQIPMMPSGGSNQMRSQSQDKSKMQFKNSLSQKAPQAVSTQDDSMLPHSTTGSTLAQKGANFKNLLTNQKKHAQGMKGAGAAQQINVKLPRTGIEQPFMRDRPRFNDRCREFEAIHPYSQSMSEDYARMDAERSNMNSNQSEKIVYDCFDYPPQKKDAENNTPYIDENDLIELPPEESPVDHRKYYPYGPSGQSSAFNQKVPKNNRYYTKLRSFYTKESDDDQTLIFESRFESGNLRRAVKIGDHEYNLILKYDHMTTAYTQWFFFRIQNVKKFVTYKFNIVNLVKPESSYNQGMKPLFYSKKDADAENGGSGYGWYRDGQNICYFQNQLKKKGGGFYYTLTFTVQFKHDDDEVFLSHCYPYTYSDCTELLQRLCTPDCKDRIRKTIVCKTLAGNDCEMAIITNFSSRPEEIAIRRAIVITSRVHPGESNASYIVEGILQFLVSDDDVAKYLRNNFVFKIIPMLNPDGVIIGNYRTSLSGMDLNRQWVAPSMKQYPENCSTKMMMRKTLESRDILFYCDIHGHSRCKNLFMYGCSNQRADRLKERIFPLLFHKNSENFNFECCNFQIQKPKETTGRVVMWKEFQLINSFTLESSFCGPTRGTFKDYHFTIQHLREMGQKFCVTLRDYASNETKVREAIQELEQLFPPPKAEEGLSSQFQQIDRNNGYGQGGSAPGYNNQGFGRIGNSGGNQVDDANDDKKGKGKKKQTGGKSANIGSAQNSGGAGLNASGREQEVMKQQFKQKNQKTTVFDVPSTSSKQSRAQNNEDGKKMKKGAQQTKKSKN